MNKHTFLKQLNKALKPLPKEDREDAILYYKEYFEEMGVGDNDEISGQVASPKEAAKEIITNCTKKHLENKEPKGGIKNHLTTIWMIILGIFAAPIAFPVALILFILIFCVGIVLFCLVLAAFCASAGMVVAGIFLFTGIFFAPNFAQGLVLCGLALVSFSLGIIIMGGFVQLIYLCIRGIIALFKKLFFRKKVSK